MNPNVEIEHSDDALYLDRRNFFRMVGSAALPLAAQACVSDADEDLDEGPVRFRGVNPAVELPCQVLRARTNQLIIDDQEEISVDPAFSDHLSVGDQCRVIREDGQFALYTVAEIRNEKGEERIRMGMAARSKLGTTQTFAATLSTQVVAVGLTEAEAKEQGELIEELVDDGQSTSFVAIAPHGGWIEADTDDQALHLQGLLAGKGASSWVLKGYRPGGGSYNRWHITSTALSRNSFPGLDAIADRGFSYAVSFHGSGHDIVVIGGGAPEELRLLVRDAIRDVMEGTGINVELSTAVDMYSGDSPNNVVNWLTAGGDGGIQIEQGKRARDGWALEIAEAVAAVFDQLI